VTRRRPTPEEVLAFVRAHPDTIGRNEIARAFHVRPQDRPAFERMLRAVERTGAVGRGPDRRLVAGPALPQIAIVEACGRDEDGLPLVRPLDWPSGEEPPTIRLDETASAAALAEGGRAQAQLLLRADGTLAARIIRLLTGAGVRVVGILRRDRDGGRLLPADRRNRNEYRVATEDLGGAGDGDLVTAESLPARRLGPLRARIVERLGDPAAPAAASLIAIAGFDIPTEFPAAVVAEAVAAAGPPELAGRTDLRDLPLVTIDGADARDFDDAVWAEPDHDPDNRGGWHLVVAIADVAAYVRPGSALDREAERRGNSVYFPDRVVPMLPEALSNDLCSLVPGRDRACLAAHLWVDAVGRKRRHRFERALMRSAARLTYNQVQEARDNPTAAAPPVAAAPLEALYGAFAALNRARAERGALALDRSEPKVVLDADGRPAAVVPAVRHDSHRLIEEFMILANVAAAEELEARRRPCMYRIHDAPNPEKVAALRDVLDGLGVPGLALAKGQAPRPELFNRVLRRAAGTPVAPLVNELVLRAQAQAAYSPHNIGHFGLALRRYAHFTSPIRRYADLLVHRALLGEAGPSDPEAVAAHVSATERRAAEAERAALDRYRAALLARALGGVFAGRVSGVAPFGLFVTLTESGADGLLPMSALPRDIWDRDRHGHRLRGRRFGGMFTVGDPVSVRLVEADAVSGRLMLGLADAAAVPNRRPAPGRRQRAGGRR
jgi:ribonuclease R